MRILLNGLFTGAVGKDRGQRKKETGVEGEIARERERENERERERERDF